MNNTEITINGKTASQEELNALEKKQWCHGGYCRDAEEARKEIEKIAIENDLKGISMSMWAQCLHERKMKEFNGLVWSMENQESLKKLADAPGSVEITREDRDFLVEKHHMDYREKPEDHGKHYRVWYFSKNGYLVEITRCPYHLGSDNRDGISFVSVSEETPREALEFEV